MDFMPDFTAALWQNFTIKNMINISFNIIIPVYLLVWGTKASGLLGRSMVKWQEQYRTDPAAFFIRILGLYFLLLQIKAFANLVHRIITQEQLHEFLDIYKLEGLRNLTSLSDIITIVFYLLISWYLLNRGQLVLNFINRNYDQLKHI